MKMMALLRVSANIEDQLYEYLESIGQDSKILSDDDDFVAQVSSYCDTTSSLEKDATLCVILSVEHSNSLTALIKVLKRPGLKHIPRIILLSTVMTWGGKNYSEPIVDYTTEFVSRTPLSSALEAFMNENSLYDLSTTQTDCIMEICIIFLGLVYGGHGWDLSNIFKTMWECIDNDSPPVKLHSSKKGANTIPMVHYQDFFAAVAELIQKSSLDRFTIIPMSDGNTAKLCDIFSDVGRNVNGDNAKLEYLSEKEVLHEVINSKEVNPRILLWNLDISFARKDNLPVKSERITLTASIRDIWDEYLKANNLTPISIVIAGNPKAGKSELAVRVAALFKAGYVTPMKALDHALTFNFVDGDSGALLKGEIKALVEAKPSDGKLRAQKKGEQESVNVATSTLDATETLLSILPQDIIRQCIAAMIRTNSICARTGFVLDIWDGILLQTLENLDAALGGGQSDDDAEEGYGEIHQLLVPTKKIPELLVELQCAETIALERYTTALDIPEGGIAKASKEVQASVRALEASLASYAASVVLIESQIDEYSENPQDTFSHSHELVQELERVSGNIVRFDTSSIHQDDLSQKIARHVVGLRDGLIGWLPELTPVVESSQSGLPAESPSETEQKEMALPTFKRLRDRSITDLNAGILEMNEESKSSLIDQCSELENYLHHNVLPMIAKAMASIATVKPNDPILYMADFLKREGKAIEDSAMEIASRNFKETLRLAIETEKKIVKK